MALQGSSVLERPHHPTRDAGQFQELRLGGLADDAGATTGLYLSSAGKVVKNTATDASGAPVGAKYIVQTPDATLTNEQALSALGTGILKNTTATGVLTQVSNISTPAANTLYIGTGTGTASGSATDTTVVGDSAATALVGGIQNTGFGYQVLRNTNSGSSNCAFGKDALEANTSGTSNNGFGALALETNQTGSFSNAFGDSALRLNTASSNSAFGHNALTANSSGSLNCAFGVNCLAANTTVSELSGFGYQALGSNTSGTENSAFGARSLQANTAGIKNSAFGEESLAGNVSGDQNNAFGQNALKVGTAASFNNAFGAGALRDATANDNSAFGNVAGLILSTGTSNSFFGAGSGTNVGSGSDNTMVGGLAGLSITSGSTNTMIGRNTNGLAAGTNQTALGYQATTDASNQVYLGNSSVASFKCQVALTVVSDGRFKKIVADAPLGLDFIKDLSPKLYSWDKEKLSNFLHQTPSEGAVDLKVYNGLVAQEVQDALLKHKCGELAIVQVPEDETKQTWGLAQEALIPAIINAIKELAAMQNGSQKRSKKSVTKVPAKRKKV
jgi:hypothetical protein